MEFEPIPPSEVAPAWWRRLQQWLLHERMSASMSVVCAAISALAAALSCWQVGAQRADSIERDRQQDIQTNKIIEHQAKMAAAMVASAQNAAEALKVTIENSRNDQRAWLMVENFSTTGLEANRKPIIQWDLRNGGKSPCTFSYDFTFFISATPPSQIYDFQNQSPWAISLPSGDVLGPGGLHICAVEVPDPITEAELIAIRSGQMQLYVVGVVLYEDIFKKMHRTKFCTEVRGPSLGFATTPGANSAD